MEETLNRKNLYAVIHMIIDDGHAHGFDAYRTKPSFLEKRATSCGIPQDLLADLYRDVERQKLRPEREVFENVHARAWARVNSGRREQ